KPANLSCPPENPRLPLATIYPSSTWAGPPHGWDGGDVLTCYHPKRSERTSPGDENAWTRELGPLIRSFSSLFKKVSRALPRTHCPPPSGRPAPSTARTSARRSPGPANDPRREAPEPARGTGARRGPRRPGPAAGADPRRRLLRA